MLRKLIILLVLMLAMVLPAYAQTDEPTEQSIAEIVVASTEDENGQFNTLFTVIQAADPTVLEALSNLEAEYTVFAPTDDAFAALQESIGEEAFNALVADSAQITDVLRYHVVEGRYSAEDILGLDGQTLTTVQGAELTFRLEGETVFVNDSEVTTADIVASNGVIHVISQVLTLPTEAPSESAATAEPAPQAEVTAEAPASAEATAEAPAETASESDTPPVPELIKAGTIADVVLTQAANADAPEFTTLLAAILASDPSVVALLSDENANLTVFAPTDEAFVALIEALGSDQFAAVVGDKNQLTNLLLYHVVDGRQASADLVGLNGQALATLLEGQSLQITTDANGGVLVNGIPVVTADIEASNGVIHVITGVLSPSGQNAEESGNEAEGE